LTVEQSFIAWEAPMLNRSLFSSASGSWNTPNVVLEAVRAFAGDDGIGLDPASNAASLVGARVEWFRDRDGDSLVRDWSGHGLVYVNPPYSRQSLPPWASAIAYNASRGVEIIALVPMRSDTAWFETMAEAASRLCFWHGRLRFSGATAGAPFPSGLFYFGWRGQQFEHIFALHGRVVTL
jgi:hypothetical protein